MIFLIRPYFFVCCDIIKKIIIIIFSEKISARNFMHKLASKSIPNAFSLITNNHYYDFLNSIICVKA